MILITIQSVKPNCHSVFRTTRQLDAVLKIIPLEGVPGALERELIALLTEVQFKGTAEIQDDGEGKLNDAWTQHGNGEVVDSVSIFHEGDTTVTTQLRKDQGLAIQKAVGGAPMKRDLFVSDKELGTKCTTATILQAKEKQEPPPPQGRRARLLIWTGGGDKRTIRDTHGPVVVEFKPNHSLTTVLTKNQVTLLGGPVHGFMEVLFAPRDPKPDLKTAAKRANAISTNLKKEKLLTVAFKASDLTVKAFKPDDWTGLPADIAFDDLIFLRLG